MRKLKLVLAVFIAIFLWASTVDAVEEIVLTSPDQAVAGTSSYYVAAILMDWDGARVDVRLNSSGGIRRDFVFTGTDALDYMNAAKVRNFTVTSLHKWTLNLLVSRGRLSGTVSGTP